MCLEHGAGYECRGSCGVQQKASYPLNPPSLSTERRAAQCRREADNAASFSTRAPLNLFLIQMLARVMNFNIAPRQPPSPVFSQHSYMAVQNHTHFLAIANSFKLLLGVFFTPR